MVSPYGLYRQASLLKAKYKAQFKFENKCNLLDKDTQRENMDSKLTKARMKAKLGHKISFTIE